MRVLVQRSGQASVTVSGVSIGKIDQGLVLFVGFTEGDGLEQIAYLAKKIVHLRIFPDGSFRVLDKGEYEYHKVKLNYSVDIDKVVNYELNNLINNYKDKIGPFDKKTLEKYYNLYTKMSKIKKNCEF